jgi:hypothetical protein
MNQEEISAFPTIITESSSSSPSTSSPFPSVISESDNVQPFAEAVRNASGTVVAEESAPVTDIEKDKPWYNDIYGSVEKTFLAGFNEQVADMLQTPISAGLELYQMGFGGNVNPNLPNYDPDDHVVGARAVKDLFEAVGVNVTPPEGSLGARVGEEVALGMTGYGIVGQAAKGTKYTFGVLEPLLTTVRQAPTKALLADLGISVPAGIGGYYGNEIGGPTGESMGVLAGAFAPVALASKASQAIATPVRSLYKGAKNAKTALGMGSAGKENRAREMLLDNMSTDSRLQLRSGNMDAPETGTYTTAEILNDPDLLAAQAVVAGRSPDAQARLNQTNAETTRQLSDDLAGLNPGEVGPTNFIKQKIASASASVQARLESAAAKAQARIDKLNVNSSIDVVSKIAREEFETVYSAARAGEKEVWAKVGDGNFETDSIITRAQDIIDETPRLSGEGGTADVPLSIREIAGQDEVVDPSTGDVVVEAVPSILNTTEKSSEVQALVSRLGEDFREARAAGKLNRARQIGQLRDSILQTIMPTTGASDALTAARAYSRRLNEVFYHGPLGQLLGKNAKGGLTVNPELTLERLLGQGTKGKIGASSLREAANEYGGIEKVDNLIQEHLKAKFASAVLRGGQFNAASANTFVANNNSLDLYPELRNQMLDAASAQRLAQSISKPRLALIKRIENQSLAYKFLEEREPQAAIDSILKSKNPTKDITSLVSLAKKDPTGNTMKGIQSALYEILVDRFGTNELGEFVLTPNKMNQFLTNKTNKFLLKSVFGDDSIKLLSEVTRGASFKQRSRTASGQMRMGSQDTLQKIQSAGGTFGALIGGNLSKMGSSYTGKGLMMAGIGRRFVQNFVKRIAEGNKEDVMVILERALYDPAFAKELIKPIRSADTAKGEMALRKFAAVNEALGEFPESSFVLSEELMP